jgi:hypothetical protein
MRKIVSVIWKSAGWPACNDADALERTYDHNQYSGHCGLIDPISSNWQHYWHQSFSSSRSNPPRFLSTSVPLGQIRLRGMISDNLDVSKPAADVEEKNQHQHRTLSDESPGPGIAICVWLQCLRLRAYGTANMRRWICVLSRLLYPAICFVLQKESREKWKKQSECPRHKDANFPIPRL